MKNETDKREFLKMDRASVINGMSSSGLICMDWNPKNRGERSET